MEMQVLIGWNNGLVQRQRFELVLERYLARISDEALAISYLSPFW
jgi:hypothetical protein